MENNKGPKHKSNSQTQNQIWTNAQDQHQRQHRQGGVVSVIQYALIMDEINK